MAFLAYSAYSKIAKSSPPYRHNIAARKKQPAPSLVLCVTIGTSEKHKVLHIRRVLIDFSLTVKAETLIIISGRGSAISSTKQGKSGCIYTLVNNG